MTIVETETYLKTVRADELFTGSDSDKKETYRKFVKQVHPDLFTNPRDKDVATRCLQLVNVLWDEVNGKVDPKDNSLATIQTRKDVYVVLEDGPEGFVTSTKIGVRESTSEKVLIKAARASADNDLLLNEQKALQKIQNDNVFGLLGANFVSTLIDSTRVKITGGFIRLNFIKYLDDFTTLADIIRAHPNGIDPRHAVWMWNKLLVAIDLAHANGVIHGAVTPEHVLVNTKEHGIVLSGWTCSSITENGSTWGKAVALDTRYRAWYPDEVVNKEPLLPSVDISMAARCIIAVLGGNPEKLTFNTTNNVPHQFKQFLKGCILKSYRLSPQNASSLYMEFGQVLEDIGQPYFPRRWVEWQ